MLARALCKIKAGAYILLSRPVALALKAVERDIDLVWSSQEERLSFGTKQSAVGGDSNLEAARFSVFDKGGEHRVRERLAEHVKIEILGYPLEI